LSGRARAGGGDRSRWGEPAALLTRTGWATSCTADGRTRERAHAAFDRCPDTRSAHTPILGRRTRFVRRMQTVCPAWPPSRGAVFALPEPTHTPSDHGTFTEPADGLCWAENPRLPGSPRRRERVDATSRRGGSTKYGRAQKWARGIRAPSWAGRTLLNSTSAVRALRRSRPRRHSSAGRCTGISVGGVSREDRSA
jgi:hypothetical protein